MSWQDLDSIVRYRAYDYDCDLETDLLLTQDRDTALRCNDE